MNLCSLDYNDKDLISQHGPVARFWGSGLEYTFWGGQYGAQQKHLQVSRNRGCCPFGKRESNCPFENGARLQCWARTKSAVLSTNTRIRGKPLTQHIETCHTGNHCSSWCGFRRDTRLVICRDPGLPRLPVSGHVPDSRPCTQVTQRRF